MAERRQKILIFDANELVDLFNFWVTPPHFFKVPLLDELPEGTKVVSVHADWCRRTIELMIEHPSFDVVPDCCLPPVMPNMGTKFKIVKCVEDDLIIKDNEKAGE